MTENILLFAITCICFVTCAKMNSDKPNMMTESVSTTEAASRSKTKDITVISMDIDNKSVDDPDDDLDLMAVMMMCNDSFRIETLFLISLNETGSFPDETDKTPKCYLRCLLQNLNIASLDDGKIDPERAAVVFAGERNGEPMEDILEMTTYCGQRNETCHCEMAYNFLKCLFSMEIEIYSRQKTTQTTT